MIWTLRRALAVVVTLLWLGAPFVARHPAIDELRHGLSGETERNRIERFIAHIDAELPDDVELALWWPSRDAAGLAALGHLWASVGYELAPRRVYPLLSAQEAKTLEPLYEEIRPFLIQRGTALARGDVDVPVAVLSWGVEGCLPEGFSRLVVVMREGPGCLLRPVAQVLEIVE